MKIKVKPKEGLKVRDPKTKKHISNDGVLVEESSFWIRRIADGDVELISDVPEPAKETKPKDTKKQDSKNPAKTLEK